MRQRHQLTWLAWAAWAVELVAIACGFAVGIIYGGSAGGAQQIATMAAYSFAFAAIGTVGALITTQQPGNRVGWILSLVGLGTACTLLDGALDQMYDPRVAQLHAPVVAQSVVGIFDLVGNVVWPLNMALFILLLLVFPTGRFLGPRWRVLAWLIGVTMVLNAAGTNFTTRTVAVSEPNPLFVPTLAPVFDLIANLSFLIVLPLLLTTIISVVLRYRRARALERQQLKWFTYGTVIMLLLLIVESAITGGSTDVFFGLIISIMPLTIAIAILRYRLFDIDVIVNRTLVYGSLTALLTGIYFGSVALLQHLAAAFTSPQAAGNPLIIVVSTLLIAALFQPLRTRLQRTIDRRFFRQRYDATKTLAAFAATLRSEVELGDLERHLLGVVEETIQPTHASLWLLRHNRESI